MNDPVELDRRTWNAAVRLAVTLSAIAAVAAIAVSTIGDLPQAAIVVPVILVAFTASWFTTGRVRRQPVTVVVPARIQQPA